MKTHLLFLLFFLSLHSFGNDQKFAIIGPKGYSMNIYKLRYQFSELSYIQYLQLPTVYSFKDHKEMKVWQSSSLFPLFQLNHDARVDFYLDEWEILEIITGKKQAFEFQVYSSPYEAPSSCSARVVKQRNSISRPFINELFPPFSSDVITRKAIANSTVNARIASVTVNQDCMNRAGIMGMDNCAKTIVYELINAKDVEVFGKYIQSSVNYSFTEYVGQLITIKLIKYADGLVHVESFSDIFEDSKYYLPR